MRSTTMMGLSGLLWVAAISACSSGEKHASSTGAEQDAGANRPAENHTDGGTTTSTGADSVDRDAAQAVAARDPADADTMQAGDAARDGGDAGSSARRAYRLAATGEQLLVSGASPGLQLTDANLADDVDVVAVHQEVYGVPWAAFAADEPPPPEWSAKMQALSEAAHAISDQVFLSLSMLNGSRQSLAARTVIQDSQVKSEDNWAAPCYDFANAADGMSMRNAYVRYVQRMVTLFSPRYLNLAIEVNLFLEKCPDAAAGVMDVANAAYDAAKAIDPDVLAFPSFQIDHLYGYSTDSCPNGMSKDTCFDANYAAIQGFKRDRFAMSSYPYLQGMQNPADLPDDWFARGPARGGERGLIAETGWLSTDLVALQGLANCTTVVHSDETQAAVYLSRVLADAQRLPLELVTWWSDRDLLPSELMTNCPCDYSPTWCSVIDTFRNAGAQSGQAEGAFLGEVLLKAFGSMGLRDYDGNAKPLLAMPWRTARALPPPRD